jgi:competence protein ComEC
MPVSPGDRITALAKLREPYSSCNPGVYSYDLRSDGIVATGHAKKIFKAGHENNIFSAVSGQRQWIAKKMDDSLSPESASFLKAIIPGLKGGIPEDMRYAFSSTGLAHLLSISGTHFGLLAFIIFIISRTALKCLPEGMLSRIALFVTPTQIAVLVTVPVLMFYALISGMSIPTIRSLIMVLIYMLAVFMGRKGQWLNSLAIAAIIILLWQPHSLQGISFLLSFLAVLSIGNVLEIKSSVNTQDFDVMTKRGSRHKDRLSALAAFVYEKIKTGLTITVSALIGTAPLVALYFNQFPLISPVTNLIVTPLVCFILLPLGFVSAFVAILLNLQSLPLSAPIDSLVHFILGLVSRLKDVPYAHIHIPDPSCVMIAAYYFSCFFIIKSKFKWRFLPLLFVICFYLLAPRLSAKDLEITFLDIGQGDAAVVQLPRNGVMVIDGGSKEARAGERVIAPYLWSRGLNRIDIIAISHPHPDHYGGIGYLMNNFEIGEIWFAGRTPPGSEVFFRGVNARGIPLRILKRGDSLQTQEHRIIALHPYDGYVADSPRGDYSDENSDSLVLKIETKEGSVLFTGDIEEEAEINLIHLGHWLRSDLIKVPHHGSRTSSTEAFMDAVNPGIAVISAGRRNPFHHPHQETLERYGYAGVRIFRTDVDGAVTAVIDGSSIKISTCKESGLKRASNLNDELGNLRLALRLYL